MSDLPQERRYRVQLRQTVIRYQYRTVVVPGRSVAQACERASMHWEPKSAWHVEPDFQELDTPVVIACDEVAE